MKKTPASFLTILCNPGFHRLLCPLTMAITLSAIGCGGGLKLTTVKSTAEKPSNVAVYFKVEDSKGDPVGGLGADAFKIYEDGELVSTFESKQTILNPTVAASHYTLLLVDMSGSIAESGNSQAVVDAATAFTEKVEKHQKVAVFAFDGSPQLHTIAPFSNSGASASARIKGLASFKPSDPSTNLNGAVVAGLKELERALSQAEHPMRFGTLVVFTDGSDRAARVSNEDMRKAVEDSDYEVFAIGLGAEIKENQISRVGKNGTAMASDRQSVVGAFDTIARRIENMTKRYYLLSYCSPSRAGQHDVRIEASAKDQSGRDRRGSLESRFDAKGFAGGCDPNRPPRFDVTRGDAVAPKEKDTRANGSASATVSVTGGATGHTQTRPKAPAAGGSDFNP